MGAEVATSSFVGEPQPVEVLSAGRWIPGSLLGWRHDEAGSCRVRVRCLIGGLGHTAWTDLAHLRLPTVRPAPAPAPEPPVAVAPSPAGDRQPPSPIRIPRPRRAGPGAELGTS